MHIMQHALVSVPTCRMLIGACDPIPFTSFRQGLVTWQSSIKDQSLWLLRVIANHRVNDRKLAENYIMLPDKKVLAIYYTIVTKPIAIKQMRRRSDRYTSLDQLADDMNLMVMNSRAFNPVGSQIIEDAVLLEELFIKERKRFDPPEGATVRASAADGNGSEGNGDATPAAALAPAPEAREAEERAKGASAPRSSQLAATADSHPGPAASAEPAPVAEEAAAAAEGAGTGESSSSSSDSSSSSGSESEDEDAAGNARQGAIKLTLQVGKRQRRD